MKYTYDKDICAHCGHDKVDKKVILKDKKKPPNLTVLKCKKCDRIWTRKI